MELAGFGQVKAQQGHDQQRDDAADVEHQLPAAIEAGYTDARGQGRSQRHAAVHHADGTATQAFTRHL
ncbi:hypothetical protein D9M69_570190 [compost metagenome]